MDETLAMTGRMRAGLRDVSLIPPLLGVVAGAVSVAVVTQVRTQPLSYASVSTWLALLDLAAGLGLVVAGAVMWLHHGRGSVGVLVELVGVTWLAADWIAWQAGSSLLRSVAMVAAPFLLPLVVHLGITYPTVRPDGAPRWWLVVGAYSVTTAVSVGWALLRNPFRDRYCWSNCTVNSLLVRDDPSASRFISSIWPRFLVFVGPMLAVVITVRLIRASAVARRSLFPVLVPAAGVALSVSAYGTLLVARPDESPAYLAYQSVFVVRAGALIALAAGVLWIVGREVHTLRSIARLTEELDGAAPLGTLTTVLRRSLGDEQLEVLYWLPQTRAYVNATGHRVEPLPGRAQAITPIERNGRPIALVMHDRMLLARHDLEHEIGAAARLAVDNERLRAQTFAQVVDLKESRARIVEAGDRARRELERNLHDGAQQSLLALSYEVRLAEADARASGDAALAEWMARASALVSTAFVELRDLAHGIFPVILTEAGLGPALATYVDISPIGVELVSVPTERFADEIEIAVYVAVTAVVDAAAHCSASPVTATFTRTVDELEVDVVGADVGAADDLTHVRDRVGALGGRFSADGGHVRWVIPCA
jgi:signal transduction histidine kinase